MNRRDRDARINGCRRHAGRRHGRLGRGKGFTLIEAAITSVIIGFAFIAVLQLLAAGTSINLQGTEQTAAMNLGRNIRESLIKLPFAQLNSCNGRVYSPPIDSLGTQLTGCDDWTQTIKVQPIDPNRLTQDIGSPTPAAVRITVTVKHNGEAVTNVGWLALDGCGW